MDTRWDPQSHKNHIASSPHERSHRTLPRTAFLLHYRGKASPLPFLRHWWKAAPPAPSLSPSRRNRYGGGEELSRSGQSILCSSIGEALWSVAEAMLEVHPLPHVLLLCRRGRGAAWWSPAWSSAPSLLYGSVLTGGTYGYGGSGESGADRYGGLLGGVDGRGRHHSVGRESDRDKYYFMAYV